MKSPHLRVVFDEQMSPRVARALRELGLDVSHVGENDVPVRGSSDEVVIAWAKKHHRKILSANFDMVVLAAEQHVPVIWFDARRRSPTFREQVAIFFKQWALWERTFVEVGPDCIKAARTTHSPISFEECHRLAARRYKLSRQRRAKAHNEAQAFLDLDDDVSK